MTTQTTLPTLFRAPLPDVVADWLAQRRALGQDKRDEVWDGVYHVAPLEHARTGMIAAELTVLLSGPARARGLRLVYPFNLGRAGNFRGPDLGVVRRDQPAQLYLSTAELVVEVLSPGDESWAKLPHYASYGVGEVWVVDPETHTVQLLVLSAGDYRPAEESALFPGTSATLVAQTVDWPDAD